MKRKTISFLPEGRLSKVQQREIEQRVVSLVDRGLAGSGCATVVIHTIATSAFQLFETKNGIDAVRFYLGVNELFDV